jgi:NitT/TauT family transport system substrate-binding protein
MRKLIALTALAALALGGSLVSLRTVTGASAARPAATTHVSIMVGGLAKQIYLPNMLAQRLGYFAKNGLSVQLIDEASGQSSENEVLAGQVQAGSGSYNHTIEIQAAGKGLVDVVQLTIAPGEAEMVQSKEAGTIKSFKNLRGKNLGITEFGSGTQTLSSYLLVHNGVPVSSAHFIPVGAADTFIAAMKQGKIDAGMTTEPTISQVVKSGLGKILVDLRTPATSHAALGGNYPFICVFMSPGYVKNNKATVQKIVNAYVETLKWIHSHTAAQIAAKMPSDYYVGDKAGYIAALKAQKAMFSPNGKMPAGGEQFVLKTEKLFNTQVKGATINLGATFDSEFVNKAM